MFVCFFVPFEREFFADMEKYHYQRRATNFDKCSAPMVIKQWLFFSVPHILWHGASFYNDLWHSQPCRTFDSGAVTICFYNLGLSLLEFEHLTFTLRGKRSNRPRHHRGFENMWIQTIKKVVFATKDAHWYKNVMLQKSVTRGFAVPLHMFLFLQMKQHDLDFPTGENGKTILFFCSFVLGCKVVIKLPLSCL